MLELIVQKPEDLFEIIFRKETFARYVPLYINLGSVECVL